MEIAVRDGLPFTSAVVHFGKTCQPIDQVLIDTGSAGSVFSVDVLLSIGITPEPSDLLRRISGVGGSEFVFTKQIPLLEVGSISLEKFNIEVGALDYGFAMNGIIGMDFLTKSGSIIDLNQNVLYSNS